MKFKALIVSILVVCILLPAISLAQNKVVVIPLIDEVQCKCTGTLSSGGRWCDQGDGTVLDMTTCLVWLKYANWGGQKPWHDCTTYDDAHVRAARLVDGTHIATIGGGPIYGYIYLTDGSVEGDWRLPTKTEMYILTHGNEPISKQYQRAFVGVAKDNVQWTRYWTSTSRAADASWAGGMYFTEYSTSQAWLYKPTVVADVWPVRACKP